MSGYGTHTERNYELPHSLSNFFFTFCSCRAIDAHHNYELSALRMMCAWLHSISLVDMCVCVCVMCWCCVNVQSRFFILLYTIDSIFPVIHVSTISMSSRRLRSKEKRIRDMLLYVTSVALCLGGEQLATLHVECSILKSC
jgi:hypothetical protein